MGWWFKRPNDLLSLGAIFRAQHSRWLTRAVAGEREYPRIPIRPVDEGGFSTLMNKSGGRELAERWWECALDLVDDEA